MKNRPIIDIEVKGKTFSGILDTGADKSIIRKQDWPNSWPIQQADQTLRGLGIATHPGRSAELLKWKDKEGHQGVFQLYILDHLPVNLWGRDLLEQMNLHLTSDVPHVSPVAHPIMLAQGHIWGKGLGRFKQGITQPIES
ncbi:protease-like protein [Leptotrombidium deliense]|uniref:human endogenous retrovirus K endopeptidase n=1 Tax=Leptotrombidium deliense TaxID=299467 RepID=A0A443RWR5_9ACAR|nr:protease-like protein [Leptotrombidium deliense]